MRRTAILGGLLALPAIVVLPATATTWTVTYDPEDDVDRVGQVVLGATSGDTILVEPGTYYEHIPVEGKSLTFLSTDGPAVTVLDGSREIEGREGSLFYTLTGDPGTLSLAGLTLRRGSASDYPFGEKAGGAILWWSNADGASLRVENCIFEDNTTGVGNLYSAGGGAIFMDSLEEILIKGCRFLRNHTETQGGAIADFSPATLVIEDCEFQVAAICCCGGEALWQQGALSLTIQDCEFVATGFGEGWRDCIDAMPYEAIIRRNRFIDQVGVLATRVHLQYSGFGDPVQRVVLDENLFYNAGGQDSAGTATVRIVMPNPEIVLSRNTFVRCGIHTAAGTGAPLQCNNNIFARSSASFSTVNGGWFACNDTWLCHIEDYWGTIDFEDNISADPLFCNEETGDLRLAIQSPCAPDNSPEGCGLIGALPAECDIVPVEQTSWGSIKARFK